MKLHPIELVERLREKPKEVRVQVAFLGALCVTGVIGLLWGVTLPMRLGGLPQGDQTAQAQSAGGINSFFANTRDNLGQLISGTATTTPSDAQNQMINDAPKSDAYTAGAPADGSASQNDYQLEQQQPVVTPVKGQEVRIGTTTSQ